MEAEYREPQATFTGFQSACRSTRRDLSIDRSATGQSPFDECSFTVPVCHAIRRSREVREKVNRWTLTLFAYDVT